ncbi:MAG TPA: response regulator [Ilumatobacteraceae bacterium]|nr:response regulator [Ilumatobacteraceae bacterium]
MSDPSIHGPAPRDSDAPASQPALSRVAWAWIAAAAVGVLVFIALLAADVLTSDGKEALSAIVTAAVSAFATAAALRAAERSRPDWRRAWTFVAASTALWLLGNVVAIVIGAVSDDVVFPSLSDVFWLPALPMAIAALVAIPGRLTWRGGTRIGIDGVLLAVSLLFMTWELLLGDAFGRADLGGSAKALLLAYWVLDTLTFAMAVNVLLRSLRGVRGTVGLICTGYGLYTLTDGVFLARSLDGGFTLGSPVDAGWVVAQLLLGGTALAVAKQPSPTPPAPPGRASDRRILVGSLVAFASFLAVFVVHVANDSSGETTMVRTIELILVLGAAVLFVVTQFTTLRENLRLTSGLEQTVAERTKALTDAAQLQELTLRTVADGILGFHDGRIVLANDAACELLRLDRHQLLGQIVPDVLTIGPADHSLLTKILAELAEDRPFFTDNVTIQRRDGTAFAAETTVAPVLREHASLSSVAVFRDVTHRHEVDRMKDEFVSVVSHELRTPLTSIRGSLGLLAGGAVGEIPENGRRMVEIAVENTDRLIRLINDILDIERIESGAVVLHHEQCRVTELVAESLRVVVPVARAAGVEVGLAKIEGDVWADADRIVQTLTNLLSNAVKFSPVGGVVTLTAAEADGFVEFSVADEGRGIPADKLESIFGRFQQVDASDSRQKGGTGLGLAISRSIVEQHGGRIWAESEEGHGATFRFTVPAIERNEDEMAAVGDGPVVLVCDDDPSLLEVARMLLSTHGYRAVVAQTGAEALRLAASERPAVIILDLYMPSMDGWQTVEALKADPATADIPVLVLSVLDADDGAGLGELVERWITKPVGDSDALLEAIAELVDGDERRSRVLVVEDDEDLARVLATSLEQRGLRVLVAPTAAAATRLSRTFLPDLIVLDIVLPDGDGFAVVEQLRHDGRLAAVPLVVYTARDLSAEDRERLTLGETEVLFKSRVTPEAFERKVLALLDGALGADTDRRGP